jgi:hypothetical protein
MAEARIAALARHRLMELRTMKKCLCLAVFIVATWSPQVVAADITNDGVTVTETPPGSGTFLIQTSGKVSLAAGESFVNILFAFINPNGGTVAPFINFTPPAPGKSSTYTAQTNSNLKGKWLFTVSLNYTDAKGNGANLTKSFPFNVPGP